MTTVSDPQSSVGSEAERSTRKIRNRARTRPAAPLGLRVVDGGADSSGSDSATRVAWRRVTTLGNHAGAAAQRVGRRLAHSDPYTGRPASIRDVVEYTRKGGWVPGEHGQLLESPGYAYGVVVAIPWVMIRNCVGYVPEKPLRLLFVVIMTGLLWLCGVDWLGWMTTYWLWLPHWLWTYIALVAVSCSLVFPLPKRET